MQIKPESESPIFLQIAQGIADGILSGAFPEESRVPSITEFSAAYRINPATALKGVTLLVDEGILYKKRGLGMFVASGAAERLREQRRTRFYTDFIEPMAAEAKRLSLEREELIMLCNKAYEGGGDE